MDTFLTLIMKQSRFFIGCVFGLLFFLACQKELSLEGGNATAQNGTLQCSSITVHGDYLPDVSFTDSNYISCQINVMHPRKAILYSDAVIGFYFRDSGLFACTWLTNNDTEGFWQCKCNNQMAILICITIRPFARFPFQYQKLCKALSDSNQSGENNIVYETIIRSRYFFNCFRQC